jgi:hypothetical protein
MDREKEKQVRSLIEEIQVVARKLARDQKNAISISRDLSKRRCG